MTHSKLFLPLLILLSLSTVLVFAEKATISVDYGKLYEITYDAKDVTVSDVVPNPDEIELIFTVQVVSPAATITLTIPRELLDAKEGGEDSPFFVIADGDLVTFSEKKATDTTRTLFIQLSTGTTELEVFGTHLTEKTFENAPAVNESKEEIPTKEATSPAPEQPSKEQPPKEEIMPQTQMEEKPTQTTEKEATHPQKPFDFSKLPNWSVDISKRQISEFAIAAAMFTSLAFVITVVKRSRAAKELT